MNVQRTNGKYDSMGLLFIKFLKGRHHSTDTLTIDQWISVWRFDTQYIFSRWLINTWFRPPLLPRWYYIPTSYSSTCVIFKCQNLNYHRRKCKRLMIWCWGRKWLLNKKKLKEVAGWNDIEMQNFMKYVTGYHVVSLSSQTGRKQFQSL